jgi:hypothetical protein
MNEEFEKALQEAVMAYFNLVFHEVSGVLRKTTEQSVKTQVL